MSNSSEEILEEIIEKIEFHRENPKLIKPHLLTIGSICYETAEKGYLLTSPPQVSNQIFCPPPKQKLYRQPLASIHPIFPLFLSLS